MNKICKWITTGLVVVSSAQGIEVYVSPTGSDAGRGSQDAPFQTLEKARNTVRPFCGKEPVTVFLRGGVYTIDQTIEFDERDSGTDSFSVVYSAYPGETPVISGGKKLDGWQPDGNIIWEAPTDGMEFRQIYVNSRKAMRSRWPNRDDYFRLIEWDKDSKEIVLNSGDIQDWQNFSEVEIHIQMLWSVGVMGLESFTDDGSQARLTVRNPERDLVFRRYSPMKIPKQPYHYENAREFIDQPGEWSINRKTGVCYYYPRAGEKMDSADVIVPQVQTLLSVKGRLDHPVQHLQFEGLTFEHSGWLLPDREGYLNTQAGQFSIEPTADNLQYVARPPAAVYVECGHHLVFRRNVFKKLGAVGLDLHFGTRECEVVGNVFFDIAGSGISHAKLSDPTVEIHTPYNPEDERELCVNDWIHNNYVKNVGYEYGGAIGILSGWPVALRIDHNELQDLAYTGISVGWGWTKEPSAMRDNKIRWNLIERPMQLFGDGGGIYTLSSMPGSLIYRNFICDVGHSEWSMGAGPKCYYLDEGSGGITLQENHERVRTSVERLRLHQPGGSGVIVKPKNADMYPGIIDGAGLEPDYEDIKKLAQD